MQGQKEIRLVENGASEQELNLTSGSASPQATGCWKPGSKELTSLVVDGYSWRQDREKAEPRDVCLHCS